jgi:hypothetical protein
MIDAFDWYTVLALGIASVIIAAVLFGTGFPSRKRQPLTGDFPRGAASRCMRSSHRLASASRIKRKNPPYGVRTSGESGRADEVIE